MHRDQICRLRDERLGRQEEMTGLRDVRACGTPTQAQWSFLVAGLEQEGGVDIS